MNGTVANSPRSDLRDGTNAARSAAVNTHERGAGMIGDHIGRSLRRLEDERFLTGQGCYVDDIAVPGQLHGVVLRSPHGHALIGSIDATAALALHGVHRVFTAADLDADGI